MLSMPPKNANKTTPMPVPLAILALVSCCLLLVVGGSLFCWPELAQPRWVWPLTPFNTRFLGAIYLTSLVGLLLMLVLRRARPIRLIVLLTWVFTTVVLAVSCLQTGQFNLARRATAVWFGLYAADCLGSSYYLWYYGRRSPAAIAPLSHAWTVYLQLQASLMGLYGLGLLLLPVPFGLIWPWPLDAFHCQLYSSIFLTGAAGSVFLAWQAIAVELWAFGLIQVTLSGLVLAGVAIVDITVRKIDWSSWGNWAWMGAFVWLGIAGLAIMGESRRHSKRFCRKKKVRV